MLRVLCCSAGGFLLQREAERRDSSGVLPHFDWMEKVKQCTPTGMPNAEALLRDQFVEHVLDSSLRSELKQLVLRQPN